MSDPPAGQPPPSLRFDSPGARAARARQAPRAGSTLPVRRPPSAVARRRARRAMRGPLLPLWLRWVLSLAVAAALITLLVRYVSGHNVDTPTFASPQAEVTANREAAILIEQDQAPRTVALAPGADPARAITAAVTADMNRLIAHNEIYGPVRSVSCHPSGTAGARQTFRCSAVANGVQYPFLGVVDTATGQITYCKSDPPPVPSMRIPVSRRCR
jgi:hypothetical protein